MQLTLFSDYSLRVGLYLATHTERLVSLAEVSRAYGISRAHLVKVVQRLAELGVVETVRGRRGGLRLARPARDIGVGALVRATEPHFTLVECFERSTNTCPIDKVCTLKGVLSASKQAFLASLDQHTLADLVPRPEALLRIWTKRLQD